MADLIQLRRDTKANWDAVSGSVILAIGEVGIITDQSPLQCKVGDGVSYWNQLETQAWVGTGSLDQVSSSIADLSGSLEEGLSSLEANVSYVICSTTSGSAAKVVNLPNFELSTHCRLVVQMAEKIINDPSAIAAPLGALSISSSRLFCYQSVRTLFG